MLHNNDVMREIARARREAIRHNAEDESKLRWVKIEETRMVNLGKGEIAGVFAVTALFIIALFLM